MKALFSQNSYSDHIVNRCIDKKLSTWSSENTVGRKKFLVYIRHFGDVSYRFEGQICKAIDLCHSTVDSRVIFEPHHMLPKVQMDVIPTIILSNIVYEFVCECDAHYVGRTSQRLIDRMRRNEPQAIRKGTDIMTQCANRPRPNRPIPSHSN